MPFFSIQSVAHSSKDGPARDDRKQLLELTASNHCGACRMTKRSQAVGRALVQIRRSQCASSFFFQLQSLAYFIPNPQPSLAFPITTLNPSSLHMGFSSLTSLFSLGSARHCVPERGVGVSRIFLEAGLFSRLYIQPARRLLHFLLNPPGYE
ncbi:hypothetical protein BKA80DRAFT_16980 [Phyllosticta citrichinensis]